MANVPKNLPPEAAAQAHHIVPVSLFKDPLIGGNLHRLGIDLNGVDNGVWLPSIDYAGREASLHRGNHLGELLAKDGEILPSYFQKIKQKFRNVESREEALRILDEIRQELLHNPGRLYNEPR